MPDLGGIRDIGLCALAERLHEQQLEHNTLLPLARGYAKCALA